MTYSPLVPDEHSSESEFDICYLKFNFSLPGGNGLNVGSDKRPYSVLLEPFNQSWAISVFFYVFNQKK